MIKISRGLDKHKMKITIPNIEQNDESTTISNSNSENNQLCSS